MNILATANAGGGFGIGAIAMYVVFIAAIFYFMAYRPNKKEKAKQAELFASLEVGDTVETSAGFYGVLIDITDDTVIVEFGNNKNCRIPMRKDAIIKYGQLYSTGFGVESKSERQRIQQQRSSL